MLRRSPCLLSVFSLMFASSAVWAEMNGPSTNPTVMGALADLSVESSAEPGSSVSILQSKLDSLRAEIRALRDSLVGQSPTSSHYRSVQGAIAQMEATAAALERISARVSSGATITDYSVTTDAADQTTLITITFTDGSGRSSTLAEIIPPQASDEDADSGYDDASGGGGGGGLSDAADMLTQMMQKMSMQMAMQPSVGGMNPLANIQGTLNDLVKQPEPVPAGQQCAAEGEGSPGDGVAVYDIAAGKVYMPDGSVLEAHSGMGNMMDNPAYVNQRMNGPTPPNVYNLSLRESPFHGVRALRMTPTQPGKMFGRNGILAHSKLVRGNNGSHGCVAFADYPKFLAAFERGDVKTLVVVPKKAGSDSANNCVEPEYNTPTPGATGAK